MRRRHFADAAHTPRGEPFHQVVHGRRAVAGGASQERDEIARGAGGKRNAVGTAVFDLREEIVDPPCFWKPGPARTLGETRRGKAVFGQQLNAGQPLDGVHQPPAAVAAQLGGHLHQADNAVWVGGQMAAGQPTPQAIA